MMRRDESLYGDNGGAGQDAGWYMSNKAISKGDLKKSVKRYSCVDAIIPREWEGISSQGPGTI